jgi:dolichyl-phosphate-mannose--protein O-mannosyl transferase
MALPEQLRARLLGSPPGQRLLGWLGPLAAMVVGGVLRFWDLGYPHKLVFDETYYVKQGWSMIRYGVEMHNTDAYGTLIDQAFTNGTPDVFNSTSGDLVVHGPVGKWLIGAGEWVFGPDSSFGWRFAVCVLGTVSILMVGRIARRLLGSSVLGTIAAILVAFDGHHFVHSRTGLLDLIVMFFALAAFGALLLDRDRTRAILARRMAADGIPAVGSPGRRRWLGPWLGWRPWRWVAGLLLGLDMGTKWSGLYFLAVFAVMSLLWDAGARRAVGIRSWLYAAAVKDGILAFVSLVPVAVVTYVTTWWGWFVSSDGYNKSWASTHPADQRWAWVPDAFRSWWNYQSQILSFHVGLSTPHQYQSSPWSWLVMGRPTSMFAEYPKLGEDGCAVDMCSRVITPIGTPTIWWFAVATLFVLAFRWALRRDWRAGAILAGYVAGFLPWFFVGDRTIFQFYEVAFEPWVVLGVTYVLGMVWGRPGSSRDRKQVGAAIVGTYLVVTVLLFAWFYPLYTAQLTTYSFWWLHMWFPSWV